MTRHEFLARLREAPRKWEMDSIGRIRLDCYCPIEAVAGGKGAVIGGIELGLSDADLFIIMVTADNCTTYRDFDGNLRLQLRTACGLA